MNELNSIFFNKAPSGTSVCRWYGEFIRGRSSLQDEFREGCPKSVVVSETIDGVRQLIFQDHYVTYREIQKNQSVRVTKMFRQLVQTHAKVY